MAKENFLKSRLDKRRAQNAFRQLQLPGRQIASLVRESFQLKAQSESLLERNY